MFCEEREGAIQIGTGTGKSLLEKSRIDTDALSSSMTEHVIPATGVTWRDATMPTGRGGEFTSLLMLLQLNPRQALCRLLGISSLMWQKEGSRKWNSLFSGEISLMGEMWFPMEQCKPNLLEDSIFSRKITTQHYQIPAWKSISSLFRDASETACGL